MRLKRSRSSQVYATACGAVILISSVAGCSAGVSASTGSSLSPTHGDSGSPSATAPEVVSPSGTTTPTASPLPSLPSALKPVGTGVNTPNGPTLVYVPLARGPQQLPEFTPLGAKLYITFSCLGKGKLSLGTVFDYSPCDGVAATTAIEEGRTGVAQHLRVNTEKDTTWRILITSGR